MTFQSLCNDVCLFISVYEGQEVKEGSLLHPNILLTLLFSVDVMHDRRTRVGCKRRKATEFV